MLLLASVMGGMHTQLSSPAGCGAVVVPRPVPAWARQALCHLLALEPQNVVLVTEDDDVGRAGEALGAALRGLPVPGGPAGVVTCCGARELCALRGGVDEEDGGACAAVRAALYGVPVGAAGGGAGGVSAECEASRPGGGVPVGAAGDGAGGVSAGCEAPRPGGVPVGAAGGVAAGGVAGGVVPGRRVLVATDPVDPMGAEALLLARHTARRLSMSLAWVVPGSQWDQADGLERRALVPGGATVIDSRPAPGTAELRRELAGLAPRLEAFHRVRIPPGTVAAAARAVPGAGEPAQPEHGRRLLDLWACAAALRGEDHALPPGPARPDEDRQARRWDVHALELALRSRVLGQDEACHALARQVALGHRGLRLTDRRPRSAVLLTGGTGTGKTLLATTLADHLAAARQEAGEALIRVDTAMLTSEHLGSTLLGAPPGYVGSDRREGWLTSRIAASPHAVLLLDEIDKASPLIRDNLLLELLGNGTVTDYSGRTVDASGLDVVLTANTGARALTRQALGLGPGEDPRAVARRQVRQLLAPEVLGRLDAVVLMEPLDRDRMSRVLDQVLVTLARVCARSGYTVEVTHQAREILLTQALARPDGARRLHREVERALAAPLLDQDAGTYRTHVDEHGHITLTRTTPEDALNQDRTPTTDEHTPL